MSITYAKAKYQAEVLDQGFEEATTGTVCFYLHFRILGVYDAAGALGKCPRYERTYRQYLAGDIGARILRGDLRALGVEVDCLTRLALDSPDPVSLIGRTIDVVCDHETYEGKPRERWGIGRTRKKLALGAVKALDDKFGHLLRGGNDRPGAEPSPAADGVSDPVTDPPSSSADNS